VAVWNRSCREGVVGEKKIVHSLRVEVGKEEVSLISQKNKEKQWHKASV
jgi:hypothetical protein